MNSCYEFHGKVILRTPRFPLTSVINQEKIQDLLDDLHFLEAIYLASPVLYDECLKWKEGKIKNARDVNKIIRSLTKYYSRMTSRCTPFGLFSGCAVIHWQNAETGVKLSNQNIFRHTRFDMHWLCSLSQKIASIPEVKSKLLYFPNSSIYKIGSELRYVDYKYVNAKRNHQVSSVEASEYIDRIINAAQRGITIDDMIKLLVHEDITEAECRSFIEDLIKEQLLISELEPAITGEEFIFQIIKTLRKINNPASQPVSHVISILETCNEHLEEIDGRDFNSVEKYRQIISLITELGVPFEENKLFQTDLVKCVQEAGLDDSIKADLQQGLEALGRLSTLKGNQNLQSFAGRFYARYEDNEMPLLQVLDPETGIGYLASGAGDIAPLINDIHTSTAQVKDQQLKWGRLESFLNSKLLDAHKNKDYVVQINEEELADMSPDWDHLPASLSVMFKMVRNEIDNKKRIYLESASGSSAANLLGRFAHADPMIHELVNEITTREQENEPEVIYAEIIHLPENRIGNVLLHPAFRKYEIPYLSKSSLGLQNQIQVDDLMVSVKGSQVILRSKRLNKIIIPRLSNAHNYSHNALPVYQFLCDLQSQGKKASLFFNWGSLSMQHKFLPRVSYKGIILQPATWNFSDKDIQSLRGESGQSATSVEMFCTTWAIPRFACLADGDNELLIDFRNDLSVAVFIEAVKNRQHFVLKEFFFPAEKAITDELGNPFVNQLVAILIKKAVACQEVPSAPEPCKEKSSSLQQKFSVGSEWLYYKLYCGQKAADNILQAGIKPLTEQLVGEGLIDKWFFIRYNDPEFHIRFRMHCLNPSQLGAIILKVREYLMPFEQDSFIWKMQMDTYSREIKRYGQQSMELSESLFYHDSVSLVRMLDGTWGDDRERVRWQWGMRSVDELLNIFDYKLEAKWELLSYLRNSFAEEFNFDKALKIQLNNKHRNYRNDIDRFMFDRIGEEHEEFHLIQIIEEKSRQIAPLASEILRLHRAGQLEISLSNLLGSYIHMMLNRITTSNPRLHELVIYDFLLRHYQTMLVFNKQKQPEKQFSSAI